MSMPNQPTVPAAVGSPLGSKINWTAGGSFASSIIVYLASEKLHLTADQTAALLVIINGLATPAIIAFRTWATTTIMRQSLPK